MAKLIPDPTTAEHYEVSLRTLARWDRDLRLRDLGWPLALKIRGRNYRDQDQLDRFDAAVRRQALAERNQQKSKKQRRAEDMGA